MKKCLTLLIAFGLSQMVSYAQVANYAFSQSTGTFSKITGGTVLGNATTDEQRFVNTSVLLGDTVTIGAGIPIGFNFAFNGNIFDVFAVDANGWISLGQSSQTPSVNLRSSSYTAPISATSGAPAALQNRISAFGRNIAAQTGSELSYTVVGSAPNRTLVIQWIDYRRAATATGDSINFQIMLNETTNIVQFIYGTVTYNSTTASTAQVGLRGQANTDYNNRKSTTSWAATTAGTANNSTISISKTIFPATGLIFAYTPPTYAQYDAALSAINSPATTTPLGSNNVSVTVKNYGTDSLKSATINWSINGNPQTPYSFNNVGLPQFSSNGPITLGSFNFSPSGSYTLKTWISSPNGQTDGNNLNDTLTRVIYAQAYATLPFMETFDNTWINKTDTLDVPSTYWMNTPAYGNNSWRRNDDTISSPWTSGLSGAYTTPGANGSAHSARFHSYATNTNGILNLYVNMSPAGGKILDFWHLNPTGNDSLSIYLSTDNGTTFNFVQKLITSTTWTHHIINIGNTTSANCIIRFKAKGVTASDDIGLDEVQVYVQPDNDMTAYKWVSPASGCGLTNAEHVTIRVKNTGLIPQSNIPVKYSINGGVSYVGPEYITGPVNPGDSATYTFTASSDFSTIGIYKCNFVVKLSGDAIALNDSIFSNVTSSKIISTIPFTENFNSGKSDYFFLNSNSDAAISIDTTGVQSSYGIHFTGKTVNAWSTGNTTAATAWTHTSHIATAASCGVDATGISNLYMKFDLKETSGSNTNFTTTWYSAIVNGTDTLQDITGKKYFNPLSATDTFATKVFSLSKYANTTFSLKFISSCRRDKANSTNGVGDNVYFDNLALYIPPIINDLGKDTSICQGNSITLDAGAGVGYTYKWYETSSSSVIGTSQTLNVTNSGTYNVIVTNSTGYTSNDMITITVKAKPVANAGNDTTININTAATLQGTIESGSGNYAWTPSNQLVSANVQNPTTTNLTSSTIFTLYVTDPTSGCVGSDNVKVTVIGGALSVVASANPDTICSKTVTYLSTLPSGGSGTYTYSWSSTPSGFTSTSASPAIAPAASTTYTVIVSDGSNTASSSVAILVHALPTISLGKDTTICKNQKITLDAGIASSYAWSTGETTRTINIDSTKAVAGLAEIIVTVTNSYGCTNKDTVDIRFITCTGIDEITKSTISIYPNPTSGLTRFELNGVQDNATLTIYSIEGQTVYTKQIAGNTTSELDLTALPKGLFFVKIYNNKTSLLSKLIIQ